MVCHLGSKHLHEGVLLAIDQFSEPGQKGIRGPDPCYDCPYFEQEGRD